MHHLSSAIIILHEPKLCKLFNDFYIRDRFDRSLIFQSTQLIIGFDVYNSISIRIDIDRYIYIYIYISIDQYQSILYIDRSISIDIMIKFFISPLIKNGWE